MLENVSQSPPKVFISYSWDSYKHKNDVLNLSDRLRSDTGYENLYRHLTNQPKTRKSDLGTFIPYAAL